jgi:hypothetical protein
LDSPWWTEADDAELDLLVDELIRLEYAHRERCPVCSVGIVRANCPKSCAAIEVVLGWRERRILRSKASWLRARQAAREWLDDAKLAAKERGC